MFYLIFQPLIALVLFLNSSPDLPDRSHLIIWNEDRLLSYDDFKSESGPRGTEAALAVVGMEYSASMNSRQYQVSIVTMFDTRKSWFSTDMLGNEYILKHEQGHFDLAEIHARRLRKEIAETNFAKKSIFDKVSYLYKEANKKLHKEQQLYDKETNHSILLDNQIKWDKKFEEELKALEKYKDTLIILRF